MAPQLFDIELSGLVFNHDHPELFRDRTGKSKYHDDAYDSRYDFRTFIYDCFYNAETREVVLLCPPLLNFRKLLDDIEFSIDSAAVSTTSIEDISRGSLIRFSVSNSNPELLQLTHPLFGGQLAIGRSYLSDFAGMNAIYSISQNNRLEWIQDWLSHYVKSHGANAVVLSDNLSTQYTPKELRVAIGEVSGIEKAVIIRARYPFGPTDENCDSSLFLQRSLAELLRQRFLGQARAVMNSDIDELIHSHSGRSIFDAAVESKDGYIRANAEWVYAKTAKNGLYFRHDDHGYVSVSGKPKANRKWCVVPQGPRKNRQWLTHFIGSRKDPVDTDFKLWHFQQISTSWKVDRSGQNETELKECQALASEMKRE